MSLCYWKELVGDLLNSSCVHLLHIAKGGLDQIKYGAYRTAMKLRAVQTVTEGQ